MHRLRGQFVPCTQPPVEPGARSRKAREREAKQYWDRVSPEAGGMGAPEDGLSQDGSSRVTGFVAFELPS